MQQQQLTAAEALALLQAQARDLGLELDELARRLVSSRGGF
jgi:hypothetical protein